MKYFATSLRKSNGLGEVTRLVDPVVPTSVGRCDGDDMHVNY